VRHLYTALVHLLRPIAFAAVLWRGLRNRRYWTGLGERFGWSSTAPHAASIWVHAVSLGEVSAAAPLLRALHARYPQIPTVLTTATPTGRERALALFGATVQVRFAPYDTPGAMRRFIARIRPRLLIVMETELWPNLFAECRRRGIPMVLASARLSLRSVIWYRRCGRLFRDLFSQGTWVAAQSATDAERFIAVGAHRERTRVLGNVKFDVTVDAAAVEAGRAQRATSWASRPTWIAGSTHAGEEEAALTAQRELEADMPGALLLLVPRHPERFDAVAELLGRRGLRFERRSSARTLRPDTQVLLVDTVGELAALYASADVAFVGGSLVPVGGHNLLEPAALGLPIITGPFQANGKEAAQLLVQQGGVLVVADASGLAGALKRLFADPAQRQAMGAAARQAVEANRGSVARLVELVDPIISAER
jgi:3-deoxy-D-manno-octulosonic-acid transferase